jgi:hypothetical protein
MLLSAASYWQTASQRVSWQGAAVTAADSCDQDGSDTIPLAVGTVGDGGVGVVIFCVLVSSCIIWYCIPFSCILL